ncbi:TPA: D-2-hydroxyacid dehydrogenase [Clostridium perfringens]|uniref:D-2-hydroxyacid dehydrogenase n=1 Tax=Clostridium perfringens TaxID=1502 RepID=UPI00016BD3A6|nr:D-2-hydroxyacid dehydrogenase [Clostridium perfringens]EDT26695.1 putative D-3-phosphoglycerate dehydrogenase [Clostridium perfringens CPE str. F4969]EGT0681964.1 3-phosphoglycerate dehydrogenase [Clostridium perfringens]MDH5070527.1 D-3-phosphoglycerate dehydrogenase [Clostridium perfringens]MDH5090298.1 D-3-phosphoglycerate dehydrogenase [Clostridium perfringens]MDU2094596.1 D-2-hydroxyacid dehydrogenase [Clostridium perfringens]
MLRILLNDGLDKKAISNLEMLGCDVDTNHYDIEDLKEKIKEVDCIVIRSATKIRRELIDEAIKGGNLKLIIRGGVGLDNIDVQYAEQNGIKVRNNPNASSSSVAEIILAHMFSLARFLNQSNITMKAGLWKKKDYVGVELEGKTLGIIGMGRIGSELAKKCTALGMKIIYFDLMDIKNIDNNYRKVEFDELLRESDFISINISGTKSIIGSEELKKVKKGVFIINTSRGKALDEEAIITSLNDGTLGGVGLDVFLEEPSKNLELINHPKVSLTPHIGASTKEAQMKIGEEVINIIKEEMYK